MKMLFSYKRNLLLFIAGIFILTAAGFLLTSCGAGPQTKVTEPENGDFALQFTGAEYVRADITQGQGSSLRNKPVTVEAWVKTTATTLTTIFARGATTGAILFVDNGANCAAAGRVGFTDGDVFVCSTAAKNDGAWHHLAGVIANADHSTVHAECSCATIVCGDLDSDLSYRDEIPHIDFYVDGVFQDCAAPSSSIYPAGIDNGTNAMGANPDGVGSNLSATPVDFTGTIDEVRIWGAARTENQIQQCMRQELGVTGGVCGIDSSILEGYWKLNEGTGHKATDASGHGIDGSKYISATSANWDGGWVSGYPF
ncbi:MAG: LamG domain-containing protein [Nitrospirae bacterium]|nr:LamG domain-containing protein [Nitrospirota bacterium]